MEYGSFLFIGANGLPREMQVDFLDYLNWIQTNDFKELEKQLKEKLELKKIPVRSDDEVIEGIICTTDKKFEKKIKDKNFYECHAVAIMYVIRHIFSAEVCEALNKNSDNNVLIGNYRQILKLILSDVEDLCSLYLKHIKKCTNYESYIRKRYVHTMKLHQVLRQELYGTVSFHSFSDKETSVSIGTIRELIELRIRRAIGVMSYIDKDDNIVPLDMSKIFSVLRNHPEINYSLKLENIERLYTWANAFVHSGREDYSWIPYYIEKVLTTFTMGEWKDNGWSVDNGIVISQKTIDDIGKELLEMKNNPPMESTILEGEQSEEDKEINDHSVIPKYRLYTCKTECQILPIGDK